MLWHHGQIDLKLRRHLMIASRQCDSVYQNASLCLSEQLTHARDPIWIGGSSDLAKFMQFEYWNAHFSISKQTCDSNLGVNGCHLDWMNGDTSLLNME